jgi:hypothetical protein
MTSDIAAPIDQTSPLWQNAFQSLYDKVFEYCTQNGISFPPPGLGVHVSENSSHFLMRATFASNEGQKEFAYVKKIEIVN